jgi:hypothetical protein
MRIRKSVLVSLAAVGCIVAQEPSGRRKTDPGKLDFTFRPQPPSMQQTEPGKLDFTFSPRLLRRPIPKGPPTAIAPYSVLSSESSTPLISGVLLSPSVCSSLSPGQRTRNGLCGPTVNPRRIWQITQREIPSPCSIPLLEAPISKDTDFTIWQLRPRIENLAPMPNVKPPAPSCAENSGPAPSR